MDNYIYTSRNSDGEIIPSNIMALLTKLGSLEESFKNNALTINNNEIENLKNSEVNNKITAWNWSKSFTQQ
ncbi:hypothetical protein B4900_01665 [Yersinia rohdei]|nr:hypothetical protein B4900_01665 [Yersinia rohdei]